MSFERLSLTREAIDVESTCSCQALRVSSNHTIDGDHSSDKGLMQCRDTTEIGASTTSNTSRGTVPAMESARKNGSPEAHQIVETLTETLLALMAHKQNVFVDNLLSDYPVMLDSEARIATSIRLMLLLMELEIPDILVLSLIRTME